MFLSSCFSSFQLFCSSAGHGNINYAYNILNGTAKRLSAFQDRSYFMGSISVKTSSVPHASHAFLTRFRLTPQPFGINYALQNLYKPDAAQLTIVFLFQVSGPTIVTCCADASWCCKFLLVTSPSNAFILSLSYDQ